MNKLKAQIIITQQLEIEIPMNKIDTLLKGFREIIDEYGDEPEMFEHIAYNVAINGSEFVEGIGKVKVNGIGNSDISVEYKRSDIEMETFWLEPENWK